MATQFLYKIVTINTWNESLDKDSLKLSEFDRDFIHLATEEQVPKIIQKFFPNEIEVCVLKLEVNKLIGDLVKEKNPGGETEYYHLYNGSIPKTAIVDIIKLLRA